MRVFFLITLVIVPAFLGSEVEDNKLAIVLSGFGFCVLIEAADEVDFVDMMLAPVLLVCPLLCGTALLKGCAVVIYPSANGEILWKGTTT